MKLQRHKFKYLAYQFDLDTGTLVPIECFFEYVLPRDVEQLELAFERSKEHLEEAEERADFLRRGAW